MTIGSPRVREIRPVAGVSERAVLEAAAIAERRSEHPLATAILRRADALGLPQVEPETFSYTPGRGIVARVNEEDIVIGNRVFLAEHDVSSDVHIAAWAEATSEILVARGGILLGAILIADPVRPEAADAIRALRDLGIRTLLLTGDAPVVARAVGDELRVDGVHAELLPQRKAELVTELEDAGRTVAMVGDGVNDAPALMRASIGIAMGSGTDVARESADIVLLSNDLSKFVETVRIARRARGIIQFNFFGTLAVDAVGVGLAAFGLLNPLLAAFIHVTSELTFILNSARLLPAVSRTASNAPRMPASTIAPAA